MSQVTTSNTAVQKPNDKVVIPQSFRELLAALAGQTERATEALVNDALSRQYFDKQQQTRLCKFLLKNQFLNIASVVLESITFPEPEHRCLMAQIAYCENRYSEAIAIWSEEAHQPLSIRDHFSLIAALQKTGQKNASLRETDRLASNRLTSEKQLQRLCSILLQQERPDKTIRLIENYGPIEQLDTYLFLAKAYRVSGNCASALEIINRIKPNQNPTSRRQLQRILHAETPIGGTSDSRQTQSSVNLL